MMKVILIDSSQLMVQSWKQQLGSLKASFVSTFRGKLADLDLSGTVCNCSVIVSPANAIGCMAGGFDKAMCELFADPQKLYGVHQLELAVKKEIELNSNGYLPLTRSILVDSTKLVGYESSIAKTQLKCKFINVCPTMRVPKRLYLANLINSDDEARREIVRFIFDYVWNSIQTIKAQGEGIDTIIIPGLGTGYGGLPRDLVSKAMVGAIQLSFDNTFSGTNKGLLVLKFLGEDYSTFENGDLIKMRSVLNSWSYDVLNEDVDAFFMNI